MKKLRGYQIEIAEKVSNTVTQCNICYIAMEVRTGKTTTSLEVARLCGFKRVLFLTKKKAIKSILADYNDFGFDKYFEITVINDESMHKELGSFDFVIHDEHHRFGSAPRPGIATKLFKEKYGHLPMVFLSGTPTPESKMQWFHQFWVSKNHDFGKTNFYSWFKSFGFKAYQFDHGFGLVNDYTATEEAVYRFYATKKREIKKDNFNYSLIIDDINKQINFDINLLRSNLARLDQCVNPYLVTFTQKEAGFSSTIKENILYVDLKESTLKLCKRLIRDRVIQGSGNVILADTAVKMQSKLHQMYSGTIKFESGDTMILDDSKAVFIKERFKGQKIGIFYKFKAEWDMLYNVFGDTLTDDINEFDTTKKNIALQVLSGREGISLKNASSLVFLNIDFSATSYWQARDRLTTMARLENDVYWIFSKGGIEDKIYKAVQNKKNFTTSIFLKSYG